MSEPDFFILYVTDLQASCDFYSRLFDQELRPLSDYFATIKLSSGINFGLWKAEQAEPGLKIQGGSTEMVIPAGSAAEVDERYHAWKAMGINIQQPPVTLAFGYAFVATDPDGHRLRVLA